MFEKIKKAIKLLIDDCVWYSLRSGGWCCINSCFPFISLDSYKPSFRARHTDEEMEVIIQNDMEEFRQWFANR